MIEFVNHGINSPDRADHHCTNMPPLEGAAWKYFDTIIMLHRVMRLLHVLLHLLRLMHVLLHLLRLLHLLHFRVHMLHLLHILLRCT